MKLLYVVLISLGKLNNTLISTFRENGFISLRISATGPPRLVGQYWGSIQANLALILLLVDFIGLQHFDKQWTLNILIYKAHFLEFARLLDHRMMV